MPNDKFTSSALSGQVSAGQLSPPNHRSTNVEPRNSAFERTDDTASLRESARGTWSTMARPSAVRAIQKKRTGRTADQVFGSHWGVFTASIARAGVQLSDVETLAAWQTYIQAMVNQEIRHSEFLALVKRPNAAA